VKGSSEFIKRKTQKNQEKAGSWKHFSSGNQAWDQHANKTRYENYIKNRTSVRIDKQTTALL
jgi:hypothetical protein